MGLLGPLDRPSLASPESGTAKIAREGTERRGPGQCLSHGRASRSRDGAEPFKTQNATGGEIKKIPKERKRGNVWMVERGTERHMTTRKVQRGGCRKNTT